jgi:hypothetical protein
MDPEDIRHDCVQACIEGMDVCLTGEQSIYTCNGEHKACMDHRTALGREESHV